MYCNIALKRVVLLCFGMFAGCPGLVGCGDSEAGAEQSAPPLNYVTPLGISYGHWDHHLYQWLTTHPKYEAIEALVDDSQPPLVFLFMTEREAVSGSKMQHCYVNDAELYEGLSRGAGDRQSHLADITYTKSETGDNTTFQFRMETGDGPLAWSFTSSGAPAPEYGAKLVNSAESAHDLKSGFLVFYLSESAVSGPSTQLTLGDEIYPADPWPEISVPPYFEAYRGAYSRDVHDGYFNASPRTSVRFDEQVGEICAGRHWTKHYSAGEAEGDAVTNVQVREMDGRHAVLQDGDRSLLELEQSGGELLTRSQSVFDGDARMRIDFVPSLPDLRYMRQGTQMSSFELSFNGIDSVVTGEMTVTKKQGKCTLLFAPSAPDWTQSMRLKTSIEFTDVGYEYESHMEYPDPSSDP